jgi:hypothetical protein
MSRVSADTIATVVFAIAVLVATGALVAALLERIGRRALVAIACGLAAGAAGVWILFALDTSRDRAIAALGTTVAAILAASAVAVRRMLSRVGAIDAQLDRAKGELDALVEHEVQTRAVELERTLARARADSISKLVAEERTIADERRREVAEREREATAKLAESFTAVRQRLEQRLTTWAGDLERSQQGFADELTKLGERQRQRMAALEAKLERDTESLQSTADEQKALAARLREELDQTAQEVIAHASSELEAHAAERRRALHEVAERLRKRERDLMEMIERESANAAERIQISLADVERRQVEQLERVVQRESARFAEAGSQQFDGQIRTAREDAAKRLGRELDLAVERFSREAQQVLAERMAQVGNQGAETVDRRLTALRTGLERQRDEVLSELERRVQEIESQMRLRLADLTSDAEAERLVIEARLHDVARRVDDLVARAEAQLR